MRNAIRSVWVLIAGCLLLPAGAGAEDLKVGDLAPDFTLQASDGQTYTLSTLRGQHVILAWFPKAFTGGWTAECNSLRASGDQLKAFKVAYFMISVDTLEDNTAFANKEQANFPLLADPTKETATNYGVLGQSGLASRWTFYIDPDGKILEIEKKVTPATAGEDAVARLKALGVPQQ